MGRVPPVAGTLISDWIGRLRAACSGAAQQPIRYALATAGLISPIFLLLLWRVPLAAAIVVARRWRARRWITAW